MERAMFFATLQRARLLKECKFSKSQREIKLTSFQGGFILGWFANNLRRDTNE